MTTWILLRGLTREKRHWGSFPRLLETAWPDCPVLELELPGNGELNELASPTRIAAMAAFCRQSAAAGGVPPPYLLLGESMGAMVAAAWAERHREEIAGCVLINTSFGRFSPLLQRLRPRAWRAFLGILLDRTAEGRERRVLELTSGSPEAHPRAVEEWTAIRRSRPVSKGNTVRQLLAAARFRPPQAAPVPTLVLAGARDGLVDPDCSRAIARRWHCALAVHPEAGHDLPLDDGAWVVDQIRRWLEERPESVPAQA